MTTYIPPKRPNPYPRNRRYYLDVSRLELKEVKIDRRPLCRPGETMGLPTPGDGATKDEWKVVEAEAEALAKTLWTHLVEEKTAKLQGVSDADRGVLRPFVESFYTWKSTSKNDKVRVEPKQNRTIKTHVEAILKVPAVAACKTVMEVNTIKILEKVVEARSAIVREDIGDVAAPATVHHEIMSFFDVLNYGRDIKKLFDSNNWAKSGLIPSQRVPAVDGMRVQQHFLMPEEVVRLLRAADEHASNGHKKRIRVREMIYTLVYTGVRASELHRTRTTSMVVHDRTTHGTFVVFGNKSATVLRTVPLWPKLRKVLAPHIGKPDALLWPGFSRLAVGVEKVMSKGVRTSLMQVFEAAGILREKWDPATRVRGKARPAVQHCLRHTYAMGALSLTATRFDGSTAQMDAKTVADWLGHSNLREMEQTYGYHLRYWTGLAAMDWEEMDKQIRRQQKSAASARAAALEQRPSAPAARRAQGPVGAKVPKKPTKRPVSKRQKKRARRV